MMDNVENKYGDEYFEYLRNRSVIRSFVRHFYLNNILKWVRGKSIDYGCGAGELLSRLPHDSIGFEINPVAVKYCKEVRNLNVFTIDQSNSVLRSVEKNKFSTFIMSHVMEHVSDPERFLKKTMEECREIGITRLIFVVPGEKGFKSDKTHKTFIDIDFFRKNQNSDKYNLIHYNYFPINSAAAGKWFTHNELLVVFDSV